MDSYIILIVNIHVRIPIESVHVKPTIDKMKLFADIYIAIYYLSNKPGMGSSSTKMAPYFVK